MSRDVGMLTEMSRELVLATVTYLDVTTLHKKVEKSIGQVGGKSTDHPRVEESYVGDLGETEEY